MTTSQTIITLRPRPRGVHLVTSEIVGQLPDLPSVGVLHLFVMHTSCGLCLNERADPDVRLDLADTFDALVPDGNPRWRHSLEGPDDMSAHAKSAIVGASLTIPIRSHRLLLGTWQGVCLCEFRDEGGPRKVVATVMGD